VRWIYYKKDLRGPAIAAFEQSVKVAPDNPTYQYHLGLAYAKAGDAAKAQASLNRALRLNPQFEGAAAARQTLAGLGTN
jgi:tetratricopeptide (TPR) repeat protein